ncbi:SusC/RagA family TonB-linked outer membrane protein [Chitinophaga sp. sic0106]|uniref:SusC/RagA family TonB-linked outer membrane protein n=1 Tax=Chitinophaga sp. sic0106 TaxID=2854785 RepID=UPI001C48DFD3|nr:SusC/RagA family TonB-linked outer membrane protein [Chitinophaga sp. sic0106]MBV7533260.1 SusC/RagA family TonB-linked outer membrane protein [Chitinophaga sp. sic0106]
MVFRPNPASSGKGVLCPTKIYRIMKLMSVLLLAAVMQVSASTFAQKVTLHTRLMPLRQVFMEIRKQTGYDFVYSSKMLEAATDVVINAENASLEDVLKQCFANQPLSYAIADRTIVVQRNNVAISLSPNRQRSTGEPVTGRITDQQGKPVAGVSVSIKGMPGGVTTNQDGTFSIAVPAGEIVLVCSHVGFNNYQVKVQNGDNISIKLEDRTEQMKEVVISTGIFTRKKESFTGAVNTVTGDQLRAVGNQNVIQSLKSLDPSFIVLENNLQGANPNTLPNIELRGKSSLSLNNLQDQFGADPNQPLFILDGFETTMRVVNDLDINRISAITLLKDAASTALYGAKAANGVVVVETKRPVPGKLQVSYTGDFRVEMPDLHSYNLMNAAEKLEFEKLAGRYRYYNPNSGSVDQVYQKFLDQQYNTKLAEVQRGVNTYWLNEPVQTGVTNAHSLQLTGGSNELMLGAGVSYRKIDGAMKGSGRDMWGTNMDLTYRKGKLNISNRLYLSGFSADDSPYGSFANFANANPYYRKYNEDGSIPKYLEQTTAYVKEMDYTIFNPLYNAALPQKNHTSNLTLQNSVQLIYKISPTLQLQGGFQISKAKNDTVVFRAPENTAFDDIPYDQKGSYSHGSLTNSGYQGNLMLTYAKVLAQYHQLNANVRTEIQETKNSFERFEAVGFPPGTNGNPAFARSYAPYGKPGAANSTYRRTNLLGSINYSYDQRYLVDATYRLDGSTAFGASNKYSGFWSLGAGWNLHREQFLAPVRWINQLKLRGNIGLTGNQNLGSVLSTSVYQYESTQNIFGQGLNLTNLGNPFLEWQNTLQTSVGSDIVMLDNRVSATINYYQKKTDPLVIGVAVATSTGIPNYPFNLGSLLVKGFEFNLRYSPIYNLKDRIIWTLGASGSRVHAEYGGLGKQLEGLNKAQEESNSMIRYKDGFSPDDIWAVPSLGIDPATGNELFLRADGQTTFTYNPADIRRVGNARPMMEGVANSQLTLKSFTLGLFFRYRWGGDLFNSALFNKVENISVSQLRNNQDKRALYDRWQKTGDISQFKAISLNTSTPMSSRFVQKDNTLAGESINMGWQWLSDTWIRHISLSSLRASVYMNDIFRISSVRAERGIEYPFTNTVSFSLNASF